MFVELCLILRITLHESGIQYRMDHVNIVLCDATREPPHDLLSKTTLNELKDLSYKEKVDIGDKGTDNNPHSKKMWIHNPLLDHSRIIQHELNQVHIQNEERRKPVALRAPHSLTKLAKTLSYGFDPYFRKGSFEPFETRPKPITLVAFRKNGLVPRETIKHERIASAEVAELQSPFNTISSFWSDTGFDS